MSELIYCMLQNVKPLGRTIGKFGDRDISEGCQVLIMSDARVAFPPTKVSRASGKSGEEKRQRGGALTPY
jgi:hypothetical protein